MTSIEEYLKGNMVRIDTIEGNVWERNLQREANKQNYVPPFEGYLELDFSIYVPCDSGTCKLNIDDFSQSRLESLVMLFLCSQGIELVVSKTPNSLTYVCPFNNDQKDSAILVNAVSSNNLVEPMMVWNMPRFDSETIPFDNKSSEKTFLDAATNTTLVVNSGPPQQYYTKLHFTYPVYQWGSQDAELIEAALQEAFETSVVSAGTLNSLLPWPDAIASPTGQEPYVFWNEPLPQDAKVFDNTFPVEAALRLRSIGSVIMIINTVLILLLTSLSAWKQIKDRKRQAQLREQRMNQTENLDTEAGVSAILMESKQYAMAKSHALGLGKPAYATKKDRNITGVEVDLRIVDQKLHRTRSDEIMQQQITPSQLHYDHTRPPTDRKENRLVARAKRDNHWYSDKLLSTGGQRTAMGADYDEDEDRAQDDDMQFLDLISPRNN